LSSAFLEPKSFVRSPEFLKRTFQKAEAQDYTRWLATHHYENFHIASFLLPKHLHQDFYNLYAFCRWADDLGDEMDDAAESLRLLEWWRGELEAMYQSQVRHPVFVALEDTVHRHHLPMKPFADLIHAFMQDQSVTRYRSYGELFDYCQYSANPVGRLVLYLCGYKDAERQSLSDATCTALQLANFWQDIPVDLKKGRVYLPTEAMERHGYTLELLQARRFTPEFQATMKEAVAVAAEFFEQGLPLIRMVDRRLALDLELFSRGGMRVLEKIAQQNYNVLERRPVISKVERVWLLLRSLVRVTFQKAAA
jgi:squalene synthase HpnC